jgi:hypothetical protein
MGSTAKYPLRAQTQTRQFLGQAMLGHAPLGWQPIPPIALGSFGQTMSQAVAHLLAPCFRLEAHLAPTSVRGFALVLATDPELASRMGRG